MLRTVSPPRPTSASRQRRSEPSLASAATEVARSASASRKAPLSRDQRRRRPSTPSPAGRRTRHPRRPLEAPSAPGVPPRGRSALLHSAHSPPGHPSRRFVHRSSPPTRAGSRRDRRFWLRSRGGALLRPPNAQSAATTRSATRSRGAETREKARGLEMDAGGRAPASGEPEARSPARSRCYVEGALRRRKARWRSPCEILVQRARRGPRGHTATVVRRAAGVDCGAAGWTRGGGASSPSQSQVRLPLESAATSVTRQGPRGISRRALPERGRHPGTGPYGSCRGAGEGWPDPRRRGILRLPGQARRVTVAVISGGFGQP